MRRTLLCLLLALSLLMSCATGGKAEVVYCPHTQLQTQVLDNWKAATLLAKGDGEKSRPLPYVLSLPKEARTVTVESEGFSVQYEAEGGEVSIYNLQIGKEYLWRAEDENGNAVASSSISVSPRPPRNIYVDGVTNFRDLGGWVTEEGSVVKQGLLYRSARLSENYTSEPIITEEGRETFTSLLGIRTEIDLRKTRDNENGNMTESAAGEGVEYISIPFETGGGYLQKNLKSFPKLFEVLSEEENYPIVFHCSIGTDRTGAVAFVLETLLGVEEEDIYRDYLFSNLGHIQGIRREKAIDDYILFLERFPGSDRREKAKNMLIENGVDEKDMEDFISIMTEGKEI